VTVWLTGPAGSGKSTIALALHNLLGESSCILDAENLRQGLNVDLSFSADDRAENVRRLGEVAILFSLLAHRMPIVSAISPYAEGRQAVRERHTALGLAFIEVHVATPPYVRRHFTGFSPPYEASESPNLVLNGETPDEAASKIASLL
jgi:bifunctional enzyme CysN/CysC